MGDDEDPYDQELLEPEDPEPFGPDHRAEVRYIQRCSACGTRIGWDTEPDDGSLICGDCGG